MDVSDFEGDKAVKTLRERLAVHAQDPVCNSCHKRMDHFALIMDKYDTIGGYNHHFRQEIVKINDKLIHNLDDFKNYLATDYQAPMARAFCKKLIAYMLGRDVGVQDESRLDAILAACEKDGYRVGDLYKQILRFYFL